MPAEYAGATMTEARCHICGKESPLTSGALGVCGPCVRDRPSDALPLALAAHEKARQTYPDQAERVQAALESPELLVSTDPNRLRLAELIRTYYIFLNKHFGKDL